MCLRLTSVQEASKNVVSAFSIYAVEECLLKKLPDIFSPATVLGLSDSEVENIAAESRRSIKERESLQKKLVALRDTQKTLHLMDRHKPTGRWASSDDHLMHADTDPGSLMDVTHDEPTANTNNHATKIDAVVEEVGADVKDESEENVSDQVKQHQRTDVVKLIRRAQITNELDSTSSDAEGFIDMSELLSDDDEPKKDIRTPVSRVRGTNPFAQRATAEPFKFTASPSAALLSQTERRKPLKKSTKKCLTGVKGGGFKTED